jgi:hypothetical protein
VRALRRALEASRPRSAPALTPRRTARRSPAHAAAVTNNEATFHFQKLLLHAAQLLLEAARGAAALPARAVNALHFVRVLLKFASEHLAVERLLQLVAEPPTAALGGASRAVQRARPRLQNGAGNRKPTACSRVLTRSTGELPAGGVLGHFVATALEFLASGVARCALRCCVRAATFATQA